MIDALPRPLCAALSELLRYPWPGLPDAAERCRALVAPGAPGAAPLADFAAAARRAGLEDLQELYTVTFDLEPAAAPYVGHQLLGDGPQRGPLLAKLAELFAADGFRPRDELGDHVAEVLAFLAVARPGAARDDLLRDGLLPAVDRMIAALPEAGGNPYRALLRAVLELLRPAAVATSAPARAEVR
jgi:nitrate reductase delta subunit